MKFLHMTIQTNKFEEEIEFYQDVVGLSIVRDLRDKGADLVFLADREGDTEVEIISNPDADNTGNQYLSIGFKADDVHAKRAELETNGLAPTPMISPNPSVEFFFVIDPAGVKVQFM